MAAEFLGFGVGPLHDLFTLRFGEPRIGMNEGVFFWGHFAVIQDLVDAVQFFGGTAGIGFRPFRKIEMLAPLVHIRSHEPGYGRNAGIPWPDGFVRMAVIARGAQAGGDSSGRFGFCQKITFHRRIGARGIGQLQPG